MIMRFMSQIIVSAIRLKNMSPPRVNDVARFLSPTGSGVLPRTLPSVILPVGLAAVTFAEVAVNGAVSAVILLHDVGVVGTTVVSVVRSMSIQVLTRPWSVLLIRRPWYRARSALQRSRTLWPRLTRQAASPVVPGPVPNTPVSWL